MKNHKTRKPNYSLVIFASIILIVLYFWVKDDIQQYMDIVDKRVSVDEYVRKNVLDSETIEELYDGWYKDMQILSEESELGKILVDAEISTGRIVSYAIITGIEMVMLCLLCFIIIDLCIQINRIFKQS